jgi:hypothetical protein
VRHFQLGGDRRGPEFRRKSLAARIEREVTRRMERERILVATISGMKVLKGPPLILDVASMAGSSPQAALILAREGLLERVGFSRVRLSPKGRKMFTGGLE